MDMDSEYARFMSELVRCGAIPYFHTLVCSAEGSKSVSGSFVNLKHASTSRTVRDASVTLSACL